MPVPTIPTSPTPPLDAARWQRIAECFESVLALPPGERLAAVRAQLDGDPAAVDEVVAMLESTDGARALSIEPRLLPHEQESHLIGVQLGAFRVGAPIGRGGMGEVYHGERVDGSFEQAVAIKVMRHGAYAHELVRRFDVERRILARLAHPGIVAILDGGTTPDRRPYLVMPYVDGVAITEWANTQHLDLEARLRLFVRVVDIVAYAHAQLVVHRDLKPSNILVTREGQVALLDFGIARLLEPTSGEADSADASAQTSPLRLHTPEHAAPEQVRGERAGVAADVYALGVLLYELVTGVRPHVRGSRSLIALEREILDVVPSALAAAGWKMPWKRRLGGDLERIAQMALRKEPTRRYPSAAQLAADVERWLDGLPVRATADSVGYRARRFVHRHRIGVAAGTVAAIALMALTIQASGESRRAARERDAARRAEASMNGVVEMLTALFQQANPAIVPGGDSVRVAGLLSRAEAKVDSLAGDPLTQARLQLVVGEMHHARGRPDLAGRLLARAVTTLDAHPDADPALRAKTVLAYARATDEYRGRVDALPWYARARREIEQQYGPMSTEAETARREWIAADTAVTSRSRDLARVVSDSVPATVTDPVERAERIHALGVQRYRVGDIIAATPLFEEALRLVEQALPPDHPSRWTVYGTVAAARFEAGLFTQAEEMARALHREQLRRTPVNTVGLAHATEFLAVVQASRGFLDDAETGQRDAVRLWRQSLAPTHPSQWNALAQLAAIRSARGDAAQALSLLDSASRLARGGGADDRLYVAEQRVDVLLRAGRVNEAAELLRGTAGLAGQFAPTHSARVAHEWREAVTAAAGGNAASARQALHRARSALESTVPSEHPQHAGARCLQSLLDAGSATRDAAPTPSPVDASACARYRQWGTALPLRLAPARRMTNAIALPRQKE